MPAKRSNPLRRWFDRSDPPPMLQREFAAAIGISQAYLTMLLSERPPWPSRRVLRRMVEITKGAVTAEAWLALDDAPERFAKQKALLNRRVKIERRSAAL